MFQKGYNSEKWSVGTLVWTMSLKSAVSLLHLFLR